MATFFRSLALILASTILLHAAPLNTQGAKLDYLRTVKHPSLNEMSGLVKSRRFKDLWWVHNDSGDVPRLFALNSKGEIIVPPFLKGRYWVGQKQAGKSEWPGLSVQLAANIDWEDIAADNDSLYIADMGNNGNARRDLGVYQMTEPNPRAVTKSRVLKFIPIRYPDQKSFPAKKWNFDCESLFVMKGKLYFLTKHRRPGEIRGITLGTKLYRLDQMKTDRVNTLTLIGTHSKLFAPTAADISPDGKYLAVLTLTSIWVFEKPQRGDNWLASPSKELLLPIQKTKQAEGLSFDGPLQLRLSNEQGDLYKVDLSKHGFGSKKTPRKKRF